MPYLLVFVLANLLTDCFLPMCKKEATPISQFKIKKLAVFHLLVCKIIEVKNMEILLSPDFAGLSLSARRTPYCGKGD